MLKDRFKLPAANRALKAGLITAWLATSSMGAMADSSNDTELVKTNHTTEMNFKRQVVRPDLPANFVTRNYRTDNPNAQDITPLERLDAPQWASDDRLSLTIYGGTSNTKGAVQDAGRELAKQVIGVTYVELDDHDNDPSMAKILICADGRCVQVVNAPVDYDPQKIAEAVMTAGYNAYKTEIVPYLVDATVEDAPIVASL